jgi:hypothetical protein
LPQPNGLWKEAFQAQKKTASPGVDPVMQKP